jgi:hypothetical protein
LLPAAKSMDSSVDGVIMGKKEIKKTGIKEKPVRDLHFL